MNRNDPRYFQTSVKPGMRLSLAVAAYHGKSDVDMNRFEDAADVFCAMATLHGLANLVLEEKAAHFFENATSQDFATKELPRVIEHMYPYKDRAQEA